MMTDADHSYPSGTELLESAEPCLHSLVFRRKKKHFFLTESITPSTKALFKDVLKLSLRTLI